MSFQNQLTKYMNKLMIHDVLLNDLLIMQSGWLMIVTRDDDHLEYYHAKVYVLTTKL